MFLFQGYLGYSGALAFTSVFWDKLINFYKKASWDFGTDNNEYAEQFEKYYHLNNIKSCNP